METAIHMIDHIFILTKHKIKIRIEYGFTKSLESIEMSYFENNSNYVEKNGIKYKTKIDSKLYPIALKKKYGSYLDKNFEKYSVQNYKDMGITSRNVNIKRAIKAFKSRLGGKNQVVITHACISFWFYMYATQKIPNPNRAMCLLFNRNSLVSNGLRKNIIKDKKEPKIKPANAFLFKDEMKCICLLKKLNLYYCIRIVANYLLNAVLVRKRRYKK